MQASLKLPDFMLSRWVHLGSLNVRHPDGSLGTYGAGTSPRAGLTIASARAARRLVINPALGLGGGYTEGDIEPLDCSLRELLDLLFLNA